MTTASRDAMRHPLFVEPTDAHQREDAYSGPFGFMLGGMVLPTRLELSRQYFDAANELVESIKRLDHEDFTLANPVLFLYRHALELALKATLIFRPEGSATGHELGSLAKQFEAFILSSYKEQVPAWITSRLKELAAIDPGSMAFRYAEDKYDGAKKCSPVAGEIFVGLGHLQRVMADLYAALTHVAIQLGDPAFHDMTIKKGSV